MAENKKDYAIVVGINSYVQLPRLKGAHADATAFMDWLLSPDGGGLPHENVKSILSPATLPADPFDATPVQSDIDRALRDFGVGQIPKIGRRLYFYFSGHGVGPTFDEVCMLMAGASMERPNSNLGMRLYRQLFRETGLFDEVVFILDCCRDSFKDAVPATPPWKRPLAPLGAVVDFVVLAAAYGEKAIEGTEDEVNQRRGLLTRAILEGLQKPEATDAQGRITASTLKEYVLKSVPEFAIALNKTDKKLQQQPEIIAPNTELIFATFPAEKLPKLRVHIIASPGLTGDLLLRHGTDMHIIEQRPVDLATAGQPWEIELLRNSSYLVQHSDSALLEILDPRKAKDTPYVFDFPQPK